MENRNQQQPDFKIDKDSINEVWQYFCHTKSDRSSQLTANVVSTPLASDIVLVSPTQYAKRKAHREQRRRYSITHAINVLNSLKAASDALVMPTTVAADKGSLELPAPRVKRARRSETRELLRLAEPSIYPRVPMVDRPEGAIRKSPRAKAPRVLPDFIDSTSLKLTPRKRRPKYQKNAAIIPDLIERPLVNAIQPAEPVSEMPLAEVAEEAPEPTTVMRIASGVPIRRVEPTLTPRSRRRKSFPRSNYQLKRFSIPYPNAPIVSDLMEPRVTSDIQHTDEAPLAVAVEEEPEPAAVAEQPAIAENHVSSSSTTMPMSDNQPVAETEQAPAETPDILQPQVVAPAVVPNGDELQIAISAHFVGLSNARHQLRVQCHQLDRTHYQLNVELFDA